MIILIMIFSDPISELFELTAVISTRIKRAIHLWLRPFKVTVNQYGALLVLMHADGPTQKELAQALETDTTTAMVICDGLEKKDLIRRKRGTADRRVNELHVTYKGKALMAGAVPAVENLVAPLTRALSSEQVNLVAPILRVLAAEANGVLRKAAEGRRTGDSV
jgi:DNA-binding MarR family transcriptional regulator